MDPVDRAVNEAAQRFGTDVAKEAAAVVLSAGLQIATMYVEPLPQLLRVTPLGTGEWMMVAACAAVPAIVGQLLKLRAS
ncbi:MAG: hypothetical protein A3H29_16825 [Acidobacteria bacterium RIFCSPLOWO2_02_FULL_67_21]|nr:MAG: hypothetical protein A3H29_16825 [Acidobacteria bacterium RIFCSPLOWO2_02_FULL_67_21]